MLLWKGGTLMFFKGFPPALKETNRSPEATCMKGNNNHASKSCSLEGRYVDVLQRIPACFEGNKLIT